MKALRPVRVSVIGAHRDLRIATTVEDRGVAGVRVQAVRRPARHAEADAPARETRAHGTRAGRQKAQNDPALALDADRVRLSGLGGLVVRVGTVVIGRVRGDRGVRVRLSGLGALVVSVGTATIGRPSHSVARSKNDGPSHLV